MTSDWLLQDKSGYTCRIIHGDSREVLKELPNRADLLMTSPPYADARKGLYDSVVPEDYAKWLSNFHRVFWDVLKPSGSMVINIKDKVVDGVRHHYVWETIQCLNTLGWYSIEEYIWHKKNSMPGRWPTRLRDAWEYIYHLAKTKKPYFNQEAVKIPMRESTRLRVKNIASSNPVVASSTGSGFTRDLTAWKNKTHVSPTNVLYLSTETYNRKHPAVYPVALPEFFIKLLSKPGEVIVDPFAGSGTTGVAAIRTGRHCILIDNKFDYCLIAKERLEKECGMIWNRKNKGICHLNNFAPPIAERVLEPLDWISI
jgi:site-specific DNA-methyltransferase (adenine-specific)